MTCRHNYTRITWDVEYASVFLASMGRPFEFTRPSPRVVAERCEECGEQLPLGPSDEGAVAVEVRAAEIVDAWTSMVRGRPYDARIIDVVDGAETAGWAIRNHGSLKAPEQPGEWAGYLAHAIAQHDEEQRSAVVRLVDVCAETYAEERRVAREVRESIEPSGVRLKGQR